MVRRFTDQEFEAYLMLEWNREYEQATREEIKMWYQMYDVGRKSVRWPVKGNKLRHEKGNQLLIDIDEMRRNMRVREIDGKFTFKYREEE